MEGKPPARQEMDRREVALELVKLGAIWGFILVGDTPDFGKLLKAYEQAFNSIIASERNSKSAAIRRDK